MYKITIMFHFYAKDHVEYEKPNRTISNGRRLSVQADQNHYFNIHTLGAKNSDLMLVGVGCYFYLCNKTLPQ